MKAIAVTAFNESPQLMDLPKPAVKPGTVLVKMAAAGLNPYDWKLTDGIMKDHMKHVFPLIMGVDGAGVVAEIGEGVTRFKVGDKVYGQFIHAPIGEGSYAEYIVVPEKINIAIAPNSVPLTTAAAIPTSGMTAYQLLDTLNLQKGETLLINGATGGVGSFATTLAALRGIYVIATASPANEARMKALGASEIIDHTKAPVIPQLQGKHPKGVDGLIDLVSNADDFDKMSGQVKPGGTALTTVFVANEEALRAKGLKGGNFETKGSVAALDKLSSLVDQQLLEVPVGTVISLNEVPEAIALSKSGKAKGKTVIEIGM
ncbi:NADPH:quinone reductase-like Zn-dependent oxidoreductase [Chitinophaga skermanii]|uniref:NADPH:quinone reductase-like Zn-dependent oxidoreductase n=1 Tax=Chitinophaga skermanii TaxID=331697 RepID=A0A327R246_9BACT|nr:NADP-dependent oxidoreductase [Chitinophaga skermanii]RAJ10919.1 NADPH:quinone reductase-like Zn-dependent oxidoreductase [Chitinophaga skermanii]